jgi:hypothetical protein
MLAGLGDCRMAGLLLGAICLPLLASDACCNTPRDQPSTETSPGVSLTQAINNLNFIHVVSGSGAEPGKIVRVQPLKWRPGVQHASANISADGIRVDRFQT